MFIPSKDLADRTVAAFGTPIFLTDAATLRNQAAKLTEAFSGTPTKIFFAIKANYNPHIVRELKAAGVYGIDAVSPDEVRLALDLGYAPEAIIYTPSNPGTEEIRQVGEWGVLQNLGSLSELRRFCTLFPGKEVSLRICPEVGAGEFEEVTTGGIESKFGIALSDIEDALRIAEAAGVAVVGIHSHIGSGFYNDGVFGAAVAELCRQARHFPDARFIDVGGGFGVSYRPEQPEVDITALAESARAALDAFREETGRALELSIEPGKYLVSSSTVLLTSVTTLKEKGGKRFVGVDSGFNHLVRPAMYGAYHHITNLSRPEAPLKEVVVAGNICESGDIFSHRIALTDPQEGDILAILSAGAYGSAMSSNYNLRPFAAEALVVGDRLTLTRRRQAPGDLLASFEKVPE